MRRGRGGSIRLGGDACARGTAPLCRTASVLSQPENIGLIYVPGDIFEPG